MAALNFPSSPATNDIYTSGSLSWTFDGVSWVATPVTLVPGTTIEGALSITGSLTVLANIATQVQTYDGDEQLGNGGSSITCAFDVCNQCQIDLNSATCAITLTPTYGPGYYELVLIQDATGGRLVTWATTVHWLGRTTAPVLPTPGFSMYIVRLRYDGTRWFGEGLNVDAVTA